MMKLSVLLVGLVMAVMLVLMVQAVRQELNMRELRAGLIRDSVEFKRKDASIIEMRGKAQKLKLALNSAKAMIDNLNTEKAATKRTSDDLVNNIKTCATEKEKHQKKKTELEQLLIESKSGHDATKIKFEEETNALKQQILERDKAICAFVDPAKPEGLELCRMSEVKL